MEENFRRRLTNIISAATLTKNNTKFDFTHALLNLLEHKANEISGTIVPKRLYIHIQDINLILIILKNVLSTKNDRLGQTTRTYSFICKNKATLGCNCYISLTMKLTDKYYTLIVQRPHLGSCCLNDYITKAFIRLNLYLMRSQDYPFNTLWNILNIEYAIPQSYRKHTYDAYYKESIKPKSDDLLTLQTLCRFCLSIKEEKDGFMCLKATNNDNLFKAIFTSTHLVESIKTYSHFAIDATYKLTQANFILIIFGAIDNVGKFRFIACCLCNRENTDAYNFILENLKIHCQKKENLFYTKDIYGRCRYGYNQFCLGNFS